MIFVDFGKAVSQLADPRFRRVIILGVSLTIALLFAIYALFLWLINMNVAETITVPGLGPVTWIGDLLSWGGLGILILFSVFLMVPVASAITSLFLDDVAQAVEAEHYPHLPAVPRTPYWDAFKDTVNFLGVLIGANIVALIFYLLMPPLAIFIFFALNGYLLGREYFQIAAMRRIGRDAAKTMRKRHRGQIWLAGCLMAVPLSFPLINLVIPVLGAATFTHLFHRLNRTSATSDQTNQNHAR